MPQYRRLFYPGNIYFFTVVTFGRRHLFSDPMARHLLHEAWLEVAAAKPFECQAICLLPEHLHCLWKLPEGDSDYPGRWQKIKSYFSKKYLRAGGTDGIRNESH